MSPPVSLPRRLLAVDLDGTLVRADGTVDVRDRAAIAQARRTGTVVTLATGRLAPAATAVARTLGLEAPLICADGAALVCPRTGDVVEAIPLAPSALGALLEAFAAHRLGSFVFLVDAIVGEASGSAHAVYLGGFSPSLVLRARIDGIDPASALGAIGVGPRAHVEAALGSVSTSATLELATFSLGDGGPWALRAQPRGAGKGAALARLATRLGVRREHVAAVGDWLNDLSMLAWAGRSFAMGQSPACVREAAGCVLEATATTGGGVAEAIARW